MRLINTFSILSLIAVFTFSCDEADEITVVDFTETISTTLTVDAPEDSAGSPVTFVETETIDFSTVQQIQDNIDDIQDATIDALSFEVNNYVGDPNIIASNATLNFDSTTIQIQDIDLQQADNNNTIFNIVDPAVLSALENALQSSNTVTTVTLTGTLSSSPVLFDVIIYLDVTVTADAG
jgi:hypothetical protein